ncbi:MAG: hypothetical protein ACRDP6_24110 [Actinoallomurus sp.]
MLCEASCSLSTEAGMHALWVPEPFAGVHDHDTWDTEFGEYAAIRRHVVAGNLVPINIGSDGAATFVVRVGDHGEPAGLGERETRYLLGSSPPYLLTTWGRAFLSGLEHIAAEPAGEGRTHAIHLAGGRYAVTVHLIDWKAEPEATRLDGTPAEDTLPDFVILINPAGHATRYRESLTTFSPLS